jgi:hypothetical protein
MNQQIQVTETSGVTEAENKLASIQAALIKGDKTLTPRDLASARANLEFSQLQAEARKIIAAEAAEASRKQNLLALQKRLETVAASRKTVNSKFTDFEKAFANYLTACSTYQTNLNSIRVSLREAGMYPGEQIAIVGGVAPGQNFFGIQVSDIRRVLSIGPVNAENVLPSDAIKPLVEKSLGEYSRHF